jgi:hypothetical protein
MARRASAYRIQSPEMLLFQRVVRIVRLALQALSNEIHAPANPGRPPRGDLPGCITRVKRIVPGRGIAGPHQQLDTP